MRFKLFWFLHQQPGAHMHHSSADKASFFHFIMLSFLAFILIFSALLLPPWSPNKPVTVTVLQTEVSWCNRKTLVQTDCLCSSRSSSVCNYTQKSSHADLKPTSVTILEIVTSNYSMASFVFVSIMAAKKVVLVRVHSAGGVSRFSVPSAGWWWMSVPLY